MRKLLIVAHTFFPEQNGVALAAFHMANEMTARKWQVEIFVAEWEKSPAMDEPYGYPVHSGGKSLQHRNENISLIINRFSPDAIVVHGNWSIRNTGITELAKKKQIPLFFQTHGFSEHKIQWRKIPPFFGAGAWIRRLPFLLRMPGFYRNFAAFVSLNKNRGISFFDSWLASKTIPEKLVHIPNPATKINASENNGFRERHGIGRNDFFILIAASFDSNKNQAFAIKSFIKQEAPDNVILVMIGPKKTDYAHQLEIMVSGDKRFKFLYNLERKEVEEAIASCDMAVMSSRSEQQPIFLIEASSQRKPWVSTDVGSINELRGGIVVRSNERDFFDAVMKLYHNPDLRKKLGAEGMEFVEKNLDPKIIYDRWENLLSGVIDGNLPS